MLFAQLVVINVIISAQGTLQPNELKKTEAIDSVQGTSFKNVGKDPLSCDLTENLCDLNCCYDEDCSEVEKNSFSCLDENLSKEDSLFANLYCDNLASKNVEARALLCLQHANSPYLGEFYIEDDPFAREAVPNLLQDRNKNIVTFKERSQFTSSFYFEYTYGTPVKRFSGFGRKENINIPSNIIKTSGFCTDAPIRFMINSVSNCLTTLSKDACFSKRHFNIRNFITAEWQNIDGGGNKNASVSPKITCLRNGTAYVTFSRSLFQIISPEAANVSNDYIKKCGSEYFTRLNKETGICENVVASVNYVFFRNMSRIVSAKLSVLIVDIPIDVSSFLKVVNESYQLRKTIDYNFKPIMYLSQAFSVNYFDVNKSEVQKSRRGYQFREMLSSRINDSNFS